MQSALPLKDLVREVRSMSQEERTSTLPKPERVSSMMKTKLYFSDWERGVLAASYHLDD